VVLPWNGIRPVAISYNTAPNDNRSVRVSNFSPRALLLPERQNGSLPGGGTAEPKSAGRSIYQCAGIACDQSVYWSYMSETPDKRRRADLDLFVLALIESGVTTPYELQKSAGISQGASIPALQRLLESSFVRQGKAGPRGRSDYKATATGRKALKGGWLPLVEAGPSGDLDADLCWRSGAEIVDEPCSFSVSRQTG
jgi:hypothetical protein